MIDNVSEQNNSIRYEFPVFCSCVAKRKRLTAYFLALLLFFFFVVGDYGFHFNGL